MKGSGVVSWKKKIQNVTNAIKMIMRPGCASVSSATKCIVRTAVIE